MHPAVVNHMEAFPAAAKHRFLQLRELIHETASAAVISDIQESLKWGEPSYQSPQGSPIRIDWKPNSPDVLGVYFHCSTRLVSTFRELFPAMSYEGNRAILIPLSDDWPLDELRLCFDLALRYHRLKHLPMLGV